MGWTARERCERHGRWQRAGRGLRAQAIAALRAVGPSVYAGTAGGGVAVSRNSGRSWAAANEGLTGLFVHTIASHEDRLLAGTSIGLFCSDDGAQTWQITGLTERRVRALRYLDARCFAGTAGQGIYKSDDDGATWQPANEGLESRFVYRILAKGGALYAGTVGAGVARSLDGGETWEAVNDGLGDMNVTSLAHSGNVIVAGTNSGVFRLTAKGKWES